MTIHQALLMAGATGSIYSAYTESAVYYRENSSPCEIKFKTDGTVWVNEGSSTYRYTWLTGAGTSADYEVRASLLSGNVSAGLTDVWRRLDVERLWQRGSGKGVYQQAVLKIEIRDFATSTILATADSVTISCLYGTEGGGGGPPP